MLNFFLTETGNQCVLIWRAVMWTWRWVPRRGRGAEQRTSVPPADTERGETHTFPFVSLWFSFVTEHKGRSVTASGRRFHTIWTPIERHRNPPPVVLLRASSSSLVVFNVFNELAAAVSICHRLDGSHARAAADARGWNVLSFSFKGTVRGVDVLMMDLHRSFGVEWKMVETYLLFKLVMRMGGCA